MKYIKKLDKDYYPLHFRLLTEIKLKDIGKSRMVIRIIDNRKVLINVIPYYKPI